MTKQHKALELASHLEEMASRIPAMGDEDDEDLKAASELRLQHALILQMNNALVYARDHIEMEKLRISHCKHAAEITSALARVTEYLEQP